jgi:hypothetical protein
LFQYRYDPSVAMPSGSFSPDTNAVADPPVVGTFMMAPAYRTVK